jgi:hypothetical protein
MAVIETCESTGVPRDSTGSDKLAYRRYPFLFNCLGIPSIYPIDRIQPSRGWYRFSARRPLGIFEVVFS